MLITQLFNCLFNSIKRSSVAQMVLEKHRKATNKNVFGNFVRKLLQLNFVPKMSKKVTQKTRHLAGKSEFSNFPSWKRFFSERPYFSIAVFWAQESDFCCICMLYLFRAVLDIIFTTNGYCCKKLLLLRALTVYKWRNRNSLQIKNWQNCTYVWKLFQ